MAEIITTHALLINDILYNRGDILPVVKYVNEDKECELKNVEILEINEDSILLAEAGNVYACEIPISDILTK